MNQSSKFLTIWVILFFLFLNQSHGQYKRGYYVDQLGQEISGYLNVDQKEKALQFKFKKQSFPVKIPFDSIQAISVGNKYFEKHIIEIDKSPDRGEGISSSPELSLTRETAMLQLALKGKISLYVYHHNKIKRFYFRIDDLEPQLLKYKKYRGTNGKIRLNRTYLEQIVESLLCTDVTTSEIENTAYTLTELLDVVKEANHCAGADYKKLLKSPHEGLELKHKLGSHHAGYQMSNKVTTGGDIKIKNLSSFTYGAELAYVFPGRKWSVFGEPTFLKFEGSGKTAVQNIDVTINSLILPIGVKKHLSLSNNVKAAIGLSYIIELSGNSVVDFGSNEWSSIEFPITNYPGLGFSMEYLGRYSVEARYSYKNNIIGNEDRWNSGFSSFSLIAGFKLF